MKQSERLEQFVKLMAEHSDLAVKEFERLSKKLDGVEAELALLKKVVAYGAQQDFPWFHIRGDESRHKGNQVAKVWMHMKQHPDCGEYPAAVATFAPDPLGYDKLPGLLSACRRLHVKEFLGC